MNENPEIETTPAAPVEGAPDLHTSVTLIGDEAAQMPEPGIESAEPAADPEVDDLAANAPQDTKVPEGMKLSVGAGFLCQAAASLKGAVQARIATDNQAGFHNALRWMDEAERFLHKVQAQLLEGEAASGRKAGA